mgnify:CR=1 FL=1
MHIQAASGTIRVTLQLYHYRARLYNVNLVRFCSRDPIGYQDGPLLYEYGRLSPLQNVDPTGTESVEPSPKRCYACCCCPFSILIKSDLDPKHKPNPMIGATWAVWGRVKYTIKLKFFKIPNPSALKPGENTCSIEFWELPYKKHPVSGVGGGEIPHDYDEDVWNDGIEGRPNSFLSPFEDFMHPPFYVDPKTGKRMTDCGTQKKPNYITLTFFDYPELSNTRGSAFLYFYSLIRVHGAKHADCKCGPPIQKLFLGHLTSGGWATPTSDNAPPPGTPPLP